MKRIILLLFALSSAASFGQSITTFILVRHAEKLSGSMTDNTKDPDLTDEGKKRAIRLADLLRETRVDAVYSTDYKRTRNTVGPLAEAKGLSIASYEAKKPEAVDTMLKNHAGGTIVVCGHSNTTPWMANYLTGSTDFKDFDDSDYDNVLVVSVTKKGKAKVVWLNY